MLPRVTLPAWSLPRQRLALAASSKLYKRIPRNQPFLQRQQKKSNSSEANSKANTHNADRQRNIRIGVAIAVAAVAASLATSRRKSKQEDVAKDVVTEDGWRPAFDDRFPGAAKELAALLGERFSVDSGELEVRGKELSGYAKPSYPQAVVWPETTEEVAEVVKICNRHKIPVVPYAAGTSLEGHTIASRGGVSLDVRRMDKILRVNAEDMDCVVQPGVGWMQLNEHCEPLGMFLGVDPAPGACIGGMCGTRCSGTNAVRYGTMKDQVINLTVVLADGTILKTGQRARKSSAGYDLARLFVGSEGTLGIVTEATLRLRNIPEHTAVARVNFKTVHDACNAVIEILQKGIQLGAIELMDEKMVVAVNGYSGLKLPESPCVLFKFTGSKPHVSHDIEEVRKITSKFTQDTYHFTTTKDETDQLWGARKHAFWAAQTMVPGKELMATDVCVPISKLADCIMETKEDLDASFLFSPIVGHVGDGNFHVVIMFDPESSKETAEANRLNSLMVERAIAMDGTCTGEHGVGLGKKKYLVKELGQGSVDLMKLLKKSMDPNNILNPHKIVDIE